MKPCSACSRISIELYDQKCESCFNKLVITPLIKLREATFKEISRIDAELTAKLELLSHYSHNNLNLFHICVCGERFKTGLAMISHLPDCPGPTAKKTSRNGQDKRFVKVEANEIEEIG